VRGNKVNFRDPGNAKARYTIREVRKGGPVRQKRKLTAGKQTEEKGRGGAAGKKGNQGG